GVVMLAEAHPARLAYVGEGPRRAPAVRLAASVGKAQRRDERGGRNVRTVASSQSPVPCAYTSARSRAPAASRSRFHCSAAAVEMSPLVPPLLNAGGPPARRIFQNMSSLMRKAAQNSFTV